MYDVSTRFSDLSHMLRDSGYRLTPQRLAVVRALIESEEHPSAETIYQRISEDMPTTSLATVYNTIDALKMIGQVLEVSPGSGPLRYDVRQPFRHPHLICKRCGRVEDADVPAETLRRMSVHADDWIDVYPRLDFQGVCPGCQQRVTIDG